MANITHVTDHEHGDVYSVTSAHRVSMARKPRTRCIALSDCVCYDAEGNIVKVIPRVKPRTTSSRRTTSPTSARQRKDIILQATLGSVYSPEDVN